MFKVVAEFRATGCDVWVKSSVYFLMYISLFFKLSLFTSS